MLKPSGSKTETAGFFSFHSEKSTEHQYTWGGKNVSAGHNLGNFFGKQMSMDIFVHKTLFCHSVAT